GLNHKTSTTDFSGVTLFDTDVDSLTLGFDAQSYDLTESWYTRHALTHGEYDDLSKGSFNKYNAEANWLRIFETNHMITLRGSLQYSPDELLPSSEQFQIGGMYSVRGYPEGLLKGDKGYSFSIEYDVPFPFRESGPWENPFTDKWRAFAFFDHGGAFPFKGNNAGVNDDDFLSSIGFGLGVNFDKTLRGRVVVGVPLSSRDDKHDDVRIHFYLQNIPF
ncbi:MAG: BamA/TamA family outer membrane protein, partial [Sedimenticola sp.]|nr:BamA/TamA family outer membrane protein [Sedimenticola sp.]